ncbi:MAG: IS66 family insertion sequence element accessory protein TnpB [Oscillospiraceae bacterium]|nr:IS66 family insertion sequence element accessory protein TnpB [Oscillospiraceae bacterium]
MNTREIASEYRLAHWAQIIQDRISSGKSTRNYCESLDIKESAYYYWQRKLREVAYTELAPANRTLPGSMGAPNGWTLCKPGIPTDGGTLTVEIGNFRINVISGVDTALLTRTCQILKTLC